MNIEVKTNGTSQTAVIRSSQLLITDVQSALDLFMTVKYETGCTRIVLNKEAVTDEFFILSTGLAGEILQKFMNYGIKLAVWGDFSGYTSKPLKDFIYESNQGNDFFFLADCDLAIERMLSAA
ncbi:MAG: DUF4180 domain-containing protein [Lachnospiraceae bacterium]|nr:DUF4180 domain-containing protein [Lachnospiraceae bacterium]